MTNSKHQLECPNSGGSSKRETRWGRHLCTISILLFSCVFCNFTHAQIISTFAGTGVAGFSGDGGPATAAQLGTTVLGYFDSVGNYYFGTNATRVRMVDNSGIIHTLAGTGSAGFSGDNGPATAANIGYYGFAIDYAGNIFIGDYVSYRMRKVDKSTGIITTIAGNGVGTFAGDGGPATAASVAPTGVCTDDFGNIYFVDGGGVRVRKIDPSGTITTIAGTGVAGWAGDGGPATAAAISVSPGICSDIYGNIYLPCDSTIRKIDISTGIISKIAGTNGYGYIGDNIPATTAQFSAYTIGINRVNSELFISDIGNDRVYKIDNAGIFHLVAGSGVAGYNSDGIPATSAELYNPEGATTDFCGNVYVADEANHRIRKVTLNTPILTIPTITLSGVPAAYVGALVTVTATVTNAGSSYNIEWYNHGVQFSTTTVPSVTYTKAGGIDTITARVISTATYGCYDSTTSVGHTVMVAEGVPFGGLTIAAMEIYPNPVSNVLHIDGVASSPLSLGEGRGEAYTYSILSIVGAAIQQGTLQAGNNSIPIQSLPKGVYILEITSEEPQQKVIKKIIKQ